MIERGTYRCIALTMSKPLHFVLVDRGMIRLFIFLLLFFSCSVSFTQDYYMHLGEKVNRVDANGLKQGTWVKFFTDSTIKEKLIYVNDTAQGPFEQYYHQPNSDSLYVMHKGSYLNGKMHGDVQWIVSVTRTPLHVMVYRHGKKIGTYPCYSNGQKTYDDYSWNNYNYKTTYHMNGVPKSRIQFRMDWVWNIEFWLSDMGDSLDVGDLEDGNGLLNEYYANGQLAQQKKYAEGELVEITMVYDSLGNPLKKGSLKKGTGTVIEYFSDGSVRMKYSLRKSQKHGSFVRYSANGKQIVTGQYKRGKPVGVWKYVGCFTRYNRKGEIISKGTTVDFL